MVFKSTDRRADMQNDIEDMGLESVDDSSEEDELDEEEAADPIAAERRRRAVWAHKQALRESSGEPQKPGVTELQKLRPNFVAMLKSTLAN